MHQGIIHFSGNRRIVVEGSYWGRVVIRVDGTVVHDEHPLLPHQTIQFKIGELPAKLSWEQDGFRFDPKVRAAGQEVRLDRMDDAGAVVPRSTHGVRRRKNGLAYSAIALIWGVLLTVASADGPPAYGPGYWPYSLQIVGPVLVVGATAYILLVGGTLLFGDPVRDDELAMEDPRDGPPPPFKLGMGWRYAAYADESGSLCLQIEPMASGPDLVYVPDEEGWKRSAPPWARERRSQILRRLKSVSWNRNLEWVDTAGALVSPNFGEPIPGSLESTEGGRKLETKGLFNAGNTLSHHWIHEMWHRMTKRFCESATGTVTVFADDVVKNSVFEVIELPALRSNPNVKLEIRTRGGGG